MLRNLGYELKPNSTILNGSGMMFLHQAQLGRKQDLPASQIHLRKYFGLTYGLLIRMLPFLDHFDVDFLGTTLKLRRVPGFDLLTRRAGRV